MSRLPENDSAPADAHRAPAHANPLSGTARSIPSVPGMGGGPVGDATSETPLPGAAAAPAPSDTAPRRALQGVQPVRPGSRVAGGSGSRRPAAEALASRPATRVYTPSTYGAAAGRTPDAPRPRRRGVLSTVLIVVGVCLLLAAGGIFIKAQLGYREAAAAYEKIEGDAVTDTAGDGVPQIDFDALQAVSEDIVGWIYIPNSQVNYPVAQGDDNEQYLRHLPDGTWNENGTIFMDMDDTAPGMVDQQTTLYGHHMNDGSMFVRVDDSMDQEEFDKIGAVYYITREATYKLKPLYTMQVQDTYTDARMPNFESDDAFRAYLRDGLTQARAQAPDANERIDSTDQVMTLVTCAGEIIPRTTRAAMVCTVEDVTPRT